MAVERIDCANDVRVIEYRDVGDPDLVRTRGLFIAEGRLVVRRVIDDRRFQIRSLLLNDAARRDLGPALDALHGVPIYVCDADAFRRLTGFNIHRGCLALVERPPTSSIDTLLDSSRTLIVLEAITNADNVGGIFRNAAAFGADGIVLSPTCCDPYYRKAIRTSMAAVLRVPFARASSWPGALSTLRSAGFTIVALTPREPSKDIDEFVRTGSPARVALVAGTEGGGLTPDVEAAADCRVRIPISGAVDSLNVAVAVGVALYQLRRPRGM